MSNLYLMKPYWSLLLLVSLIGNVDAQLPERETEAIAQALYALNLTPLDLSYTKGSLQDSYRLPLIHRLLHDPLSMPGQAEQILSPLRQKPALPSMLLKRLIQELPQGEKPAGQGAIATPSSQLRFPEGFPTKARAPVSEWVEAFARAYAMRQPMYLRCTAQERRQLRDSALWMAAEQPELGLRADPEVQKNPAVFWNLINKVEWGSLWQSAILEWETIEKLAPAIKTTLGSWKGSYRVSVANFTILIAGAGNDSHTQRADIILDIGGDDLYTGEAAQARIIVDMAGHDRYRAKSVALGCGVLRVGLLWDMQGDDLYEGEALTQGFGAFGIGVLFDEAGHDIYRADLYAQGASRTWGVGLLADFSGNDLYRAGGRFVHAPLLEQERATFSFAQGFSIGYRPDRSGGIGLLWDGAGDDSYSAGTYSQGASYWFSFGTLIDESGNDQYASFYYSQASAMHLTAALLMDKAGHDSYICQQGAMHAIGHDWGVAMLWDHAGNDVYAGGDSRPAVGTANGVGIFIDSAGNDRYFGPPAVANPARETGSVGVFVDLGGSDQYAQGFKDGYLQVKGQWASAMDLPADASAAPSETSHPEIPKPVVGSLPLPGDSELERLYKDACLWEVGSARETVRRARHTLIGIGKPAAQWMVEKKLAELTSTLVERAFVEVLQETESGDLVLVPLQSEDPKKREPALRLATLLRVKGASSSVLKMLQTDSAMRSRAIVAAGALQVKEAVPVLAAMADDAAPMTQLSIALALGKIGEPSKAVEWLSGQLSHPELPIREACANALTLLGEPGVFALREAAESTEVSLARLAIQTLGRAKQTAGLEWLSVKATHEDWGMRLTVLQAIRALNTEEASQCFETLIQQEKDWRVLRVLQVGGEQK